MNDILTLAEENYLDFYSRIIQITEQDINHKGEATLKCPVHDDKKGSLKINLRNGKWNCFGCEDGGGNNPLSFFCWLHECDKVDAKQELEAIFGIIKTPDYNVDNYHTILMNNDLILNKLHNRGLTSKTIRKFKLGFYRDRVCLPEYDFGGTLRQVVMHDVQKLFGEDIKSLNLCSGVGVRLFPLQNLRRRKIYIFEGWLDAILAIQNGLNAVSITGSGAKSWNDKFNKYFKDREVFICYDVDIAGVDNSEKLANKLVDIASSVSLIKIPKEKVSPKGDYTEFVNIFSHDEFMKIEPVKWKKRTKEDTLIQDIHLGETLNTMYYGKKIRTKGIVTGKAERYNVPKRVEFKCNLGVGKECASCRLSACGGELTTVVPPVAETILKMIRVPDSTVKQVLAKNERISTKCTALQLEIDSVYNVEELILIPEVDFEAKKSSYISRHVYALTEEAFEAGKPYIIEAVSIPHPKTQVATLLVYNHEETEDDIDNFEMNESIKKELEIFQANTLEEMKEVRKRKYIDYAEITKIYGRNPLFFAYDLIFHSCLSFYFRGRKIRRGYVNGLIFGDTRTGKSETAECLMNHFKVGECTSGENLSFAGLVGGLHQVDGSKWAVNWGLMPLNDRKLLKIDEFHGMKQDEFSKTSETISTGVATIHKIKGESAMARTRLCIISNTKEGSNLDSFQFGCQAIAPIMGGYNEDIARLDFAHAVAMTDVKTSVVNSSPRKNYSITYTSEKCHNLILWAWSRLPEEIIFDNGVEELIIEYAMKAIKTYHMSIPLVVQGEQTIKLARLVVACAAMYFSTDETGEKVIVKKEHVDLVYSYLTYIYSKECMGYEQYSKLRKESDELKNVEKIKDMGISNFTKTQLLRADLFNLGDIDQMFMSENKHIAKRKIALLLDSNAIVRYGSSTYKKTPAFIKFLNNNQFEEVNYDKIDNLAF